MYEHTTIPLPQQQLLTEKPFTGVVRHGAGSVLNVAMHGDRSMYHMLSRVKSGGGAVYRFPVAGRIACKDASLCDAFSGPWTSSVPFSTLREIVRTPLVVRNNRIAASQATQLVDDQLGVQGKARLDNHVPSSDNSQE